MKETSKYNDERAERLNSLMFALRMNATDLSVALGYDNPETIYRILHKKQGMSIIAVDRVYDSFKQVSIMWLLFGIGDMMNDEDTIEKLKKENSLLTEIVRRYEIIVGSKNK